MWLSNSIKKRIKRGEKERARRPETTTIPDDTLGSFGPYSFGRAGGWH